MKGPHVVFVDANAPPSSSWGLFRVKIKTRSWVSVSGFYYVLLCDMVSFISVFCSSIPCLIFKLVIFCFSVSFVSYVCFLLLMTSHLWPFPAIDTIFSEFTQHTHCFLVLIYQIVVIVLNRFLKIPQGHWHSLWASLLQTSAKARGFRCKDVQHGNSCLLESTLGLSQPFFLKCMSHDAAIIYFIEVKCSEYPPATWLDGIIIQVHVHLFPVRCFTAPQGQQQSMAMFWDLCCVKTFGVLSALQMSSSRLWLSLRALGLSLHFFFSF